VRLPTRIPASQEARPWHAASHDRTRISRRAITRLPLGVSSNFRYWGEDKTIYVAGAKGARLRDIDGNEYIDYRMAYGPCILGYADPRVDAAARNGIDMGGVFALSTEREYAVAERISKMVPAAELVRFSNSGTEAVMAALRLARAYTGKDSYVVVEGGYHGVFDAALWYTRSRTGSPPAAIRPSCPYSAGVPSILPRAAACRADERRGTDSRACSRPTGTRSRPS
jgi:glutamate-1-semialdehyde 2,1-aminomutase